MVAPFPITALEIVAYANRLAPKTLPSIVPPCFRVKSDPKMFLLPPFVIREGFVCNASKIDASDLEALEDAGEITRFDEPFPAQRDYELWIDEDGGIRYEAIPLAAANLRKIAERNIDSAKAALRKGDFDEAESHCRVALCADDRLTEPLAISAAIARRNHDTGRERTIEMLAKGCITDSEFKSMVDRLAGEIDGENR
jgi:hypothetical protein